ncbi:MAG: hypothetical protein HC794_00765 [Nitrospiraceae bacterium]|nr:hypothetical protein [Nitrospiraceae bacterium]
MNDAAAKRMTELKTGMLLYYPFFASLLYDMMDVKVGKFPEMGLDTAGTDGRNLWIDEDFLVSLDLSESVFVMCHEIGHAMWHHMQRARGYRDIGLHGAAFNSQLYNVAADYVINDTLKVTNTGKMPKDCLWDAKYTHLMLVEDVYKGLMKPQKSPSPSDGSGKAPSGAGTPSPGKTSGQFDKHIYDAQGPQAGEGEWKRAVQSAANAAKAQGMLPSQLERFVENFLNPQVPWQEKLRYHVVRAASRDSKSWHAPHRRRLVSQRMFYPRNTGFGAGEIVVAVDTSGSIGQTELDTFFSELAAILDDCKPEAVWVLGVDAAVNSVERIEAGTDIRTSPPGVKGGGGTAFEPAFDWCDKEGIEPATLIYFTDMYGSFPKEAPKYPVIWCATTPQVAPWGETVFIEVK